MSIRLVEIGISSFTPPLFLLSVAGWIVFARRQRGLAVILLALVPGIVLLNAWRLTANQESTFLPALAVAGLGAPIAVAEAVRLLAARRTGLARVAVYCLPLLAAVPLLRWNQLFERRHLACSEEYGRNILGPLPPRTLLLCVGDLAPINYLQGAAKYRTDVAYFRTYYLMGMTFARDAFRRQHPEIEMQGMESALERNPSDLPGALRRLIADNAARRPIHMVEEIANQLSGPDGVATEPYGLTYRVANRPGSPPENGWDYHFRNPTFPGPPPKDLELFNKMEWIHMVSRYAISYDALSKLCAGRGDKTGSEDAAMRSRKCAGAYQDLLQKLSVEFPSAPFRGRGAPLGVSPE